MTQTSETQVINYSDIVTDAGIPTSFDFKVFRVQNDVENCSSGRQQAMIDALRQRQRHPRPGPGDASTYCLKMTESSPRMPSRPIRAAMIVASE